MGWKRSVSALEKISRGWCVRDSGSKDVLREQEKKEICFKELAHMVTMGSKCEICRDGWWSAKLGRSRVSFEAAFLLLKAEEASALFSGLSMIG